MLWSDEMWVNARLPKPANSSPGTGYDVVKRHMHPDDRKRVIRDLNDTATSGRVNRIEYRSFRGDGTMHWEEVLVAREVGADGKPVRLVGTCIDISARKEASELLAISARTDALTGLANRTMLNERLAAGCSAAKRRRSKMALLFLDLNGFKAINDTMGHAGRRPAAQERCGAATRPDARRGPRRTSGRRRIRHRARRPGRGARRGYGEADPRCLPHAAGSGRAVRDA